MQLNTIVLSCFGHNEFNNEKNRTATKNENILNCKATNVHKKGIVTTIMA